MTRESDKLTKLERAKKLIDSGRAATDKVGVELTRTWDVVYAKIYDDIEALEDKVKRLELELARERKRTTGGATGPNISVARALAIADVKTLITENYDVNAGADVLKQIIDSAIQPEQHSKTDWGQDAVLLTRKIGSDNRKSLGKIIERRANEAKSKKPPRPEKPDEEETHKKESSKKGKSSSAHKQSQTDKKSKQRIIDENDEDDGKRGWELLPSTVVANHKSLTRYRLLQDKADQETGKISLELIKTKDIMKHLVSPSRTLPKEYDNEMVQWADAVVQSVVAEHTKHDAKQIWERTFPITSASVWYDTDSPEGKAVWTKHARMLKNHRQIMWEASYGTSDRRERNQWNDFTTARVDLISLYIEKFGFVDALEMIRPGTDATKTFHFGTRRLTLKKVAHRKGLAGVKAHLNERYDPFPSTRTQDIATTIVPLLRKKKKTVSAAAKLKIIEEDEEACKICSAWRTERRKKAWAQDLWGKSGAPDYGEGQKGEEDEDEDEHEDESSEDENEPPRDDDEDETDEEPTDKDKRNKELFDTSSDEEEQKPDTPQDKKDSGGDGKRKDPGDQGSTPDPKKHKTSQEASEI